MADPINVPETLAKLQTESTENRETSTALQNKIGEISNTLGLLSKSVEAVLAQKPASPAPVAVAQAQNPTPDPTHGHICTDEKCEPCQKVITHFTAEGARAIVGVPGVEHAIAFSQEAKAEGWTIASVNDLPGYKEFVDNGRLDLEIEKLPAPVS